MHALRPSLIRCLCRVSCLHRHHFSITQTGDFANLYWNDKYQANESKFEKILIANRGEIACRIIRTCRRLGIRTVAVYSSADSNAQHVQLADESVYIGPAPTCESYLCMDAILEAVRITGSEAVHPGYGFLSENTQFAKHLDEMNVVFLGPNSHAILSLGDKIQSKMIAQAAKVNCIPGYEGEVVDEDEAVHLANEIGYPVMIKASAGGGGKGMRISWNDRSTRDGFRLSREEARSSFGDERMLMERFIDKSRHIEIQVLCDRHGNAVFLNERECSIQRRNQKMIEEAPSTFLTNELRLAMGNQAVALAKAVGYDSAGTVEFLVDSRNFYFLEMNTRLQVEHPITECITGVDIVHQMIRIGKGHMLLHKQSDIPIHGWAFECRVYAEDPLQNFGTPSIGRLTTYTEPNHSNVRCDSGVHEGSEISIYYDSMICKLVTFGVDREQARKYMLDALDRYVIQGVKNNIPLLRDILSEEKFIRGDTNTKYIYEVYPDGFKGKQFSLEEKQKLAALSAVVQMKCLLRERKSVPYTFSVNQKASSFSVLVGGDFSSLTENSSENFFHVDVSSGGDGIFYLHLKDSGKRLRVHDSFHLAQPVVEVVWEVQHEDGSDIKPKQEKDIFQLIGHEPTGKVTLAYLGSPCTNHVLPTHTQQLYEIMPAKKKLNLESVVIASMPGLVKSMSVVVGDHVKQGQEVCVVEAMKMQNPMHAGRDGTVKHVYVKTGQAVDANDLLVDLE